MRTKEDIDAELGEKILKMDDRQLRNTKKFVEGCNSMPPGGSGCGLHPFLLSLANYAVRAGLSCQDFVIYVRYFIHGTRQVFDREIIDAYDKAAFDFQGQGRSSSEGWEQRQKPSRTEQQELINIRDNLIKDGKGVNGGDISMESPIPPSGSPTVQARQIIESLFKGGEFAYVGSARAAAVKRVNLLGPIPYIQLLKKTDTVTAEHIVPNPFTGKLAPKKGGTGTSLRCDNAVARFHLTVAEFDNLSIDDQLAFWSQSPLPVAALIHSGGKSIHAWIRTGEISSMDEWDRVIKRGLYDQYLIPMGVDAACSNPSRLSRMPGHYRKDKNQIQQLLYLNPNATQGPIL